MVVEESIQVVFDETKFSPSVEDDLVVKVDQMNLNDEIYKEVVELDR